MRSNPTPLSWIAEASALLAKDFRAELRTKVAVSAIGVYTFSALLLISLATATLKMRFTENGNPLWEPASKFGILWVLLCFAAFTGLAHSFVHEEEAGTVMALRLRMSAGAVYAGKFAFNLLLILAVTTLVTPAYITVTEMPVVRPFMFICVMFSGCVGLAGAATIIAALAAKAQGTGALFAAIGLPLLLVFFMLLMNAATTLYAPNLPTVRIIRDVGGLLSYGVLIIAVSILTFIFVWEE